VTEGGSVCVGGRWRSGVCACVVNLCAMLSTVRNISKSAPVLLLHHDLLKATPHFSLEINFKLTEKKCSIPCVYLRGTGKQRLL